MTGIKRTIDQAESPTKIIDYPGKRYTMTKSFPPTHVNILDVFCGFEDIEHQMISNVFHNIGVSRPINDFKCDIPLFIDSEQHIYQNRRKSCKIQLKAKQNFVYFFVQSTYFGTTRVSEQKGVKDWFQCQDKIIYRCRATSIPKKGCWEYRTITSKLLSSSGPFTTGFILCNKDRVRVLCLDYEIGYYDDLKDPSIKNTAKKQKSEDTRPESSTENSIHYLQQPMKETEQANETIFGDFGESNTGSLPILGLTEETTLFSDDEDIFKTEENMPWLNPCEPDV